MTQDCPRHSACQAGYCPPCWRTWPLSWQIGDAPFNPAENLRSVLKQIAARLPLRWQQEMKRHLLRRNIGRHRYGADEPEVQLLGDLVGPGDWVIDVGANVGHYTLRLSELVGSRGRVLAFEPVPDTFELLAAAACLAPFHNITLFNAAASSSTALASMSIPRDPSGLRNYYRAQLGDGPPDVQALCLPVDGLELPARVALVKIDAEGHELSVLHGMSRLLQRDHPVLLVEDSSQAIPAFLARFGYQMTRQGESFNCIYRVVRGARADRRPDPVAEPATVEEGVTPLG